MFGLDETLAELFSEGWQANDEAAAEIIKRLGAHKNYIPASERAHKEYAYILLKEYKNISRNKRSRKNNKTTNPYHLSDRLEKAARVCFMP